MSAVHRRPFTQARLACNAPKCRKRCKTTSGLKRHRDQCKYWNHFRSNNTPSSTLHQSVSQDPLVDQDDCGMADLVDTNTSIETGTLEDMYLEDEVDSDTNCASKSPERTPNITIQHHPIIDGTPCDCIGTDLPTTLLLHLLRWTSRPAFRAACSTISRPGPSFANHDDLYATIDSVKHGDSSWKSFSVLYNGKVDSTTNPACWMTETYEVWYRDLLAIMEKQLANLDFRYEIDYAPKLVHANGTRQYTDLMSGNWAWREANKIAEDETCDGTMLVPVVLGSDKTTVSVATGNNEFYPLYGGIGNVHNKVRRAHRDAISLIALLAIPKSELNPYTNTMHMLTRLSLRSASREYQNDANFHKFRRQLFHTSLYHILRSLKPYMTQRACRNALMVTSAEPFTLSAHTSPTTLSRCTVLNDHLDLPGDRRFCEHTTALQEACTLQELWDNYGVVGNLIVSKRHIPSECNYSDVH
ncbi:Transcriptional repressor TUP [Salix suchowensis]|nr:Transcriptional repressor TUP [Salix suchowensis]